MRRPAAVTILLLSLLWPGIQGCAQDPDRSDGKDARISASTRSALALHDVGARPRAVAVADFNGDGHQDVAVANAGDGTVSVLAGNGSGQLRGSGSFAAGPEPSDVDAADIDRDGAIDLVVANHETSHVTVLLNDGQGRFAPASGSPFDTGARPHVHGLATGDFDGDGWVDIAVDSADTKDVRVLRGTPRGLDAAISISVGTMPYFRLGVGDVTGDGRLEILVPGHGDNTLRTVGSEDGHFRADTLAIRLARQPWMVVAGDVNGDGRDDIVVVETDAVTVWLAGAGGFAEMSGSPLSVRGATEVAVGDLDGDGAADVAVGPWDGDEVTLFAGKQGLPQRMRICERPIGLAIADLNADGQGELLATCTLSNQLAVKTVAPMGAVSFLLSPAGRAECRGNACGHCNQRHPQEQHGAARAF
jgi:hypothetical protein